jgi:ABC-type multidrug transport system ATPase subunit
MGAGVTHGEAPEAQPDSTNRLLGVVVSSLSVAIRQRPGYKFLLQDISFSYPRGEFVAIIGASGCGKSTLIRTLAGLQDAQAGKVLLAGHPVQELRDHFPLAVGFLPQFGTFHPDLTVQESLMYAAALRLPKSVARDIRNNWLKHIVHLARIEDILPQPYTTLSGGQMRRVALAEQLIGDPEFLLLDELTSGLDVHSDQEIMLWLRRLAHELGKTVILVTHSTYHLDYCDRITFLDRGRLIHCGTYASLLESHGAHSVAQLYEYYQAGPVEPPQPASTANEPAIYDAPASGQILKTAQPPSGFWQFPILLARQVKLLWRDKGQLSLHLVLMVTFPCLVAIFAIHGLPQVRSLTLSLETNVLRTLQEQLFYLKESFHAASVISGLAMFQVILLTLTGANNGAREIAKENDVLEKELRAGLSSSAYVLTKFMQIAALSAIQAFWMAWFVKIACGFPGELSEQFAVLFLTTLAMSTTCLAISAAAPSAERASLLAIYIVGFQLPLSGAALSLPDWLSTICRPFIVAYWGWSGYLQTFRSTRHFDIVSNATHTSIADYDVSVVVLSFHIFVALLLAGWFVSRKLPRTA